MTPKLRNSILRAQREVRRAEGTETPADIVIERQYEDMEDLKQFCGFHLALPTAHEIEPKVEWNGHAAAARFTLDGHSFTVRKELNEFVLLAEDHSPRELARVDEKSSFTGSAKLLSALGDFLGISGTEVPEA